MTRLLIAKRPLRYATRRLKAGETFEAKDRDANLLTRVGRAEYAPADRLPVKLPPMPESLRNRAQAAKPVGHERQGAGYDRDAVNHERVGRSADPLDPATPSGEAVQSSSSDDLTALRAEYQAKVGRRPFPGWGADELRKRMAEAE